ncbi:unnamed protein product [Paramecium primaurelia]|uniref:Uncharacterized protein n=1 Tax=Paramecium primaurelia TaxID=5886 RepID=A0A8S1P7A3_PARPR|nr:unnamed protein product [Paramecium primaurelia]
MLQGQHQHSDFIAVILVYGIIFSEYYAFVFIFLPAFLNKHGHVSYLIGIEFTIIFIFLNFSYIMIQYVKPGYPPKDLAKHYHEKTLEDIKQRTKKMTEKINKHRQRRMQNNIEFHDENDDEIVIKQFYNMVPAILFKYYNQFHTALNVRIQNYQEHIIVKNAINAYQEWIIIVPG